jgi:hypothetical protein
LNCKRRFNRGMEKLDSLQAGTTNSQGARNALRGDSKSASSGFRAPSSRNPAVK